jgi:ABC-2 type transport system permease protein
MILHIARHELRRTFHSPLAWVVLGVVQFLVALFFYILLSRYLEPSSWRAATGITEFVVAGTLQIASGILLLVTPLLTMRSFSEEQRGGTIDLLLSSPISLTQLVLGKYLGVLAFLWLMVAMVALMPLSLLLGTQLDAGHCAAAFIGLALLLGAFAAVGLFMSTLTAQPTLAAVGGFAVLFVLWIIHLGAQGGGGQAAAVFGYLSLMRHYDNLLRGFVNSADVAYYLLIIGLFLSFSVWRLDAARCWR